MENSIKLFRFLTHNGNSPDSRLFCRSSHLRLERFSSWDGIDPVRLLPEMSSARRLGRLPSSGGRLPFSA